MVLTWACFGLFAWAAAVAGYWYLRRVDALGRRRSFPWPAVTLLVALAVAAAVPGMLRAAEERRLSAAASVLAGAHVAVHCQTFGAAFVDPGPELGWVRFGPDGVPQHQTLIKRDACRDLAAYLRSGKHHPSLAQVVAVHVLDHESMHMAGITAEAAAECAAVQRDARTAGLLGASPADALALARAYWRAVYPRLPDEYRSPACAPGAQFDERLANPPW
jgi:hypothetical protein